MIRVKARSKMPLPLGREGENLAREIVFDISDWQAEYGQGIVSLIAQRPCDDVPYPCAITIDGSTVIWPITAVDTAWHGNYGECELQYRVDDVLVKSETWCTSIFNAMGEPSETPPEPYQGWVDQVLQAGADAQTAAAQARENATAAEEDRQSAEDARDAAGQSAIDADASAKAAQTAQEGAEAAKTDAGEYAAGAGVSAEAAAVSASDSKAAQQGAENARDAADQSATSAAESAMVSKEAADRTEAAAIHQPYPNSETGTWWVWDAEAEAYKDTGASYGTTIETADPTDAVTALAECGIVTPAYQDGVFYTDASGAIYVL